MENFTDQLHQTQEKLRITENIKDKEKLWAEEFNIYMHLSAVYEDLLDSIDELEHKEGMTFICNRLRQKANLLNKTGVINV